jgi:hypothetical protein
MIRKTKKTKARARKRPLPIAPAVYSIAEFCAAHRMSRSWYNELRNSGFGPIEMQLGKRRWISLESAADWRWAREGRVPRAQEGLLLRDGEGASV